MREQLLRRRIDELLLLKDGWFDGEGKGYPKEDLEWFFDNFKDLDTPFLCVFPIPFQPNSLEVVFSQTVSADVFLTEKRAEVIGIVLEPTVVDLTKPGWKDIILELSRYE